MFDTLRASQRLRDEGGFNEPQAQAIAGVLAEEFAPRLAMKEDLDRLEERFDKRLEHFEERFDKRIEHLEERFDKRIEHLEERLDERLEHLEERLKHYVNVRVGAMVGTATALLLAAIAISTAILAAG